jgi:hypothetical protein
MSISRDYGVLLEDEGIALRGLFIIDPKGVLRYVFSSDGLSLVSYLTFSFAGKSLLMTSLSADQLRKPSA